MRVLCFADKCPDPNLIRSSVEEVRPDLIITLGDLDGFALAPLKNFRDIPKIGVYGNHCSGNYFPELGILNMHLSTWEFGGLTFGGFQGSVRYKPGDHPMFTQEEADVLMKNFPHVDIFLAHAPPFGINDEPGDHVHEGFRALRTYINEQKPRYFFHGHTYPVNPETRCGDTEIVYITGIQSVDIS